MRRVYNFTVPVDDDGVVLLTSPKTLPTLEVAYEERTGDGGILRTPVRYYSSVRFWVESWDGFDCPDEFLTRNYRYRVFGTGHEIPDGFEWVGTAPRTDANFIWHLYRMRA